MIPPANAEMADLPVIDLDPDAMYSLEVIADLTGVASQTILLYQEQGLLATVPSGPQQTRGFDDEALRTLRRIEYLRSTYGMNLSGIKLMLDLMNEVERLQHDLRLRR